MSALGLLLAHNRQALSRALARTISRWLLQPPLLGATYMVVLSLWAAPKPSLDERQGGAQARQIEAVILRAFRGEIARTGVAILATAIVVGAFLGWAAAGLMMVREGLGAPADLDRSRKYRPFRALALIVALHSGLMLWAMAHDPQLYADAWYARGGWSRSVQLLATDVLGTGGVATVWALACATFLAGSPARWRQWLPRVSRALEHIDEGGAALATVLRQGRFIALCAALFGAGTLFALAIAHTPPASARSAHGAGAAAPSEENARPNILVLAADSMRADRLDPRTAPHLSSLADRGTRFDRAYVSLPRTFPSWVTLLTGRHPHHHGVRSMFPRWEERTRDFDALPMRLARAGWATGVVSDYAGDIFSRIDLGFQTVNVPEFDFRQLVRQHVLEQELPLLPVLNSRLGRAAFPVMREMNAAADPSLVAKDAVRMMRTLESHGPFFLVVFFSTAHFPYSAPSPYYQRFTDPKYAGRFKYHKPVGLGIEAPADAHDEEQIRALYDGAVSAIDDSAQSVLDALASDGLDQKTVVVVTADHGETLFDHGHGQGHGDHLFGDEGTHVPLAIYDPRRPLPHRNGSIVRDVDLAPTLYALTGVTAPSDVDGRTLVPALEGATIPRALAYAETGLWFTEEIPGLPAALRLPYPGIARLTEVDTQHGDELVLRRAIRPLTIVAKHRMVRDERWKLLYLPTRSGVHWMLFDTVQDPGERTDVAASHPDVVARLQSELSNWMRRDTAMTERGDYLVARQPIGGEPPVETDPGLVRLDDVGSRKEP